MNVGRVLGEYFMSAKRSIQHFLFNIHKKKCFNGSIIL